MAEVRYEPVVKQVRVSISPERAFELFTTEMGTWWPLASHSIGGSDAVSVRFAGEVGGLIVETTKDGATHPWGRMLTWEPPERVVFSWHPGREENSAQRVEVTFRRENDRTLVTLVHDGWELLGEAAEATRAGYDTGWDLVFVQAFGGAGRTAVRKDLDLSGVESRLKSLDRVEPVGADAEVAQIVLEPGVEGANK